MRFDLMKWADDKWQSIRTFATALEAETWLKCESLYEMQNVSASDDTRWYIWSAEESKHIKIVSLKSLKAGTGEE